MNRYAAALLVPMFLAGGLVMAQTKTSIPTSMALTSTSFVPKHEMPSRYTCDGTNVSPPLQWSKPPDTTRSFAFILEDPDAPGKTWTHWVLFNWPVGRNEMDEAIPPSSKLPNGAIQSKNDFEKVGYGGPCPPKGTHRYYFRIYALDRQLDLTSAASKAEVMKAMQGHILAQGELMGTYARQPKK